MPYVNIKVTQEGVTAEHKRQLIEGVTELLHTVLNKPPASTFVVIDEIGEPREFGKNRTLRFSELS